MLFTSITFIITILFNADVEAQGGAYATGVLVLMALGRASPSRSRSAAQSQPWLGYRSLTLVFVYTTVVNIIERPDGVKIASWFILTIIVTSLISRVMRSTELRVHVGRARRDWPRQFLHEAAGAPVRIIANRPDTGLPEEYEHKLREAQRLTSPAARRAACCSSRCGPGTCRNSAAAARSTGADVGGHRVLRCVSPAIPNAIAALLLYIRDETGKIPHAYFGWTEGNPIVYLLKFLAFGEGDTAPVTREVLQADRAGSACAGRRISSRLKRRHVMVPDSRCLSAESPVAQPPASTRRTPRRRAPGRP